jgi:acyl dehydratase
VSLVNELLHFEDLEIGDQWTSRGRTVTETDIVNFAGLSGDFDPLHVDHEHAKRTTFGKPVAHGLLGLSLVAGLSSQCPAVNTVAFAAIRDWQFLTPIFVGDTVRAVSEVIEKPKAGRRYGRVVWQRKLVSHNGNILQSGTFETLVAMRHPSVRRRERETVPSSRLIATKNPK